MDDEEAMDRETGTEDDEEAMDRFEEFGEMADAVKQVREAVQDEGNHPYHHRKVLREHRRQWPALWEALDRLLEMTP